MERCSKATLGRRPQSGQRRSLCPAGLGASLPTRPQVLWTKGLVRGRVGSFAPNPALDKIQALLEFWLDKRKILWSVRKS